MNSLLDLAHILRSKNAGPLEFTFDIMFDDKGIYERVKNSGVINPDTMANLYCVDSKDVLITEYDIVNSLKVTIPRKIISGSTNDMDIYGCQQHRPLAELLIP